MRDKFIFILLAICKEAMCSFAGSKKLTLDPSNIRMH